MNKYAFLLTLAVLVACGPKQVPQKTTASQSDINRFQDDLSAVRPMYAMAVEPAGANKKVEKPMVSTGTGKSNLDITKKLDVLLDTIAVRNKSIRYAQGFRIQIYSGNDRKEAENAKSASYQLFPQITPYLIYSQPVYRVKVGDFLDRIEAEKYYVGYKASYPSAIVVPDKVDIRKNSSGN